MTEERADLGLAKREADKIRRLIEIGELQPGDPIPTIAAFGERGVSVTTARQTHQLLREWGLISGGRGAPLRVRVRHRQVVRSTVRHQIEKDRVFLPEGERRTWGTAEHDLGLPIGESEFVPRYTEIEATPELAELFGIEVGTPLLERQYETRYPKGYLGAASVSYIPVELIAANPQLRDPSAEPWPGGTQHQLFTVGIEVARIVDRAWARPPIAEERDEWGMEPGDVLLVVRSLAIDTDDRVVVVSDAMYPADRTIIESVTELQRWPADRVKGN